MGIATLDINSKNVVLRVIIRLKFICVLHILRKLRTEEPFSEVSLTLVSRQTFTPYLATIDKSNDRMKEKSI